MEALNLRDYDLTDLELIQDKQSTFRFLIWQPEATCVIIGRSCKPETSVRLDKALQDGVPVIQRPTGGMAVLLSPNMLIVSVIRNGTNLPASAKFFQIYNHGIINGLKMLGVDNITSAGISDIVVNNRKFVGCAIYRNPKQVFYHAVVNMAESPELIERYLTFPERVPEYRAGRSHREFVTSLAEQGYHFDFALLSRVLEKQFANISLE